MAKQTTSGSKSSTLKANSNNSEKITFIRGDATSPQAKGTKLIVHICNDLGGWGKGFVLAISKRWSEPEREYRLWHRQRAKNDFQLGAVQYVAVTKYVTVANMIGQRGIKTGSKGPPIRYEAVESGLSSIATWAKSADATVHMPRIGCGLAGGKWSKIEALITATLLDQGVGVFVYDYK